MTDDQIFNVITILLSVMGSVALAAWWLRDKLVTSEMRGMTAENNALRALNAVAEERRLLAEDKNKTTADELTVVKAKLEDATAQLKQNASKEAVQQTIAAAQTSTNAAITASAGTAFVLEKVSNAVDLERDLDPAVLAALQRKLEQRKKRDK
jgi:hypothetical protein